MISALRTAWLLVLLVLLGCGEGNEPGGKVGPQLADLDADDDGYLEHEDCNENDPEIHPGALELCDGIDNNCDGYVDEEVMSNWYLDIDGDGYGDDLSVVESCEEPTGSVSTGGDCDDADSTIHPGADEVCDTFDQDCNGAADDGDVCFCEVRSRDSMPYQFCDFAATWSKAREICQENDYDLVSIDGLDEQDWLVENASELVSHHWWIGLSDMEETGDWEWVENIDLDQEPMSWCIGEPDHWDDGCGVSEKAHCVTLEGQEGGCWRDRVCVCARSFFICEGIGNTSPESGR